MGVISRIGKRIDRFYDWLGLVVDHIESPAPDPLISSALAPYEHDHSRHAGLDSIFGQLRTREGCPHWSATAVVDGIEEEHRIFRCGDCGLTYRHIVDPAKPWLIVGYEPVEAAS